MSRASPIFLNRGLGVSQQINNVPEDIPKVPKKTGKRREKRQKIKNSKSKTATPG
jgi:hypothetical protein